MFVLFALLCLYIYNGFPPSSYLFTALLVLLYVCLPVLTVFAFLNPITLLLTDFRFSQHMSMLQHSHMYPELNLFRFSPPLTVSCGDAGFLNETVMHMFL